MVLLRLFFPEGYMVERELELHEAFRYLHKEIPVTVRYGRFAFASGVTLVPVFGPRSPNEAFGFLYSNGTHRLIPNEQVWKITQVIPEEYQKPLWKGWRV